MISYISWKIVDKENWKCSILTNSWVWYELNINDTSFSQIEIWLDKEFFVYHHITDVWQSLFAFLSKEEKQIFIEFMKVSWVWWKSALSILDLWISQIYNSFSEWDKDFFSNAKWIGKKTSEKIFVELKDKDFVKEGTMLSKKHLDPSSIDKSNNKQVKDTLTALWYNINRVEEILKTMPDDILEIWDMINYVIRNIK